MAFFIHVAFDIENSLSRSDYDKVASALSRIGLSRTVEKDGKTIELPANTFAGVRNYPNAMSILKEVENDIHILSKQEGIEGKVFISVAEKWEFSGYTFSSATLRQ